MGSIAITNGTLVDGAGTRRADLLIQNGVIAEVGEKLDGDTIIDADGLVVTPGFVDLQVHFVNLGGEEAETIQTGSRGAARWVHRRGRDAEHHADDRQRCGRPSDPRSQHRRPL